MSKNIAVVGGDMRQIYVAKSLAENGFDVKIFGFDKSYVDSGLFIAENLMQAAKDADAVILGLPAASDVKYINAPLCNEKIETEYLLDSINSGQLLIGGKMSCLLSETCRERNIVCHDYFEREELNILNTVSTAEGAIEIAMHETPFTLHSSKCLVCGFGKVAKTLCLKLAALGCEVCCCCRRHSDSAWAEIMRCRPLDIYKLESYVGDFDIIFNTVPAKILNRGVLKRVHENAVIIDLASKPGGVDFDAATELGKKVIWALSLPGRVAPASAGKIISNTVMNILNESFKRV